MASTHEFVPGEGRVAETHPNGWMNVWVARDETVHTIPVRDTRLHVLSTACWCHPRPQRDAQLRAYTHASMDRREEYENGRKAS